jgi:hypothetical protein
MQVKVSGFDLIAGDKLCCLERGASLSHQRKLPISWCGWSVNGEKLIASGAAGVPLIIVPSTREQILGVCHPQGNKFWAFAVHKGTNSGHVPCSKTLACQIEVQILAAVNITLSLKVRDVQRQYAGKAT